MAERIYYWIDHTARFEANSGVQRVTRCLARALEELGRGITYVHWSTRSQVPTPARGDEELRKFARLSGPAFRPQHAGDVPLPTEKGDRARLWNNWLLVRSRRRWACHRASAKTSRQ
jgi:hypothetical protein